MEPTHDFQLLDFTSNKVEIRTQADSFFAEGLPRPETTDLCSSSNFSAASPRGTPVRPVSMSDTDDGAKPTCAPISANVIPFARRSEMRDAHVIIGGMIRDTVVSRKQHPVTEFRENMGMPTPSNLPKFEKLGDRVRWWRKHRGLTLEELSKMTGVPITTLSSIENGGMKRSTQLHRIAAALKLHPFYLDTDKGEPEAGSPQEPPAAESPWPLQSISRTELERLKLSKIELSYVEMKVQEALADIKDARRKERKA